MDCFNTFGLTFKGYMMGKATRNKNERKYENRREYTEMMKGILQKVMEEYETLFNFGNNSAFKFNYYPEYYTIDHTWWVTEKCKKKVTNLYDWSLVAAIEHENDWMDWTYEVAKLDFIKAPLKVVIGYMDNSKRDQEEEIVKTQYENLKNISSDEDFGLILMNRDFVKDGEDPYDMRFYLFKPEGVKKTS